MEIRVMKDRQVIDNILCVIIGIFLGIYASIVVVLTEEEATKYDIMYKCIQEKNNIEWCKSFIFE
jgi:hypothetical protein